MFVTASLIVASVFDKETWSEGYCWLHSQVKGNHESFSNQIKIDQSVKHLKRKEFDSTLKLPEGLEKKNAEVRAIDATNLTFMFYIEINFNLAIDYADIAVKTSQYNAK